MYDQEIVRNNGQPSYSRLKTSVRLHIDQTMRTRNFRVRHEFVERGAVTKSQKRKKANVDRMVGECFQWKPKGQCSKRDSCREPLATVAGFTDEKDNRPLPDQFRRPRLTAREQNRQESQATEMKALQTRRSKIPCRYKNCNNPSCCYWHPPVCHNYKSETGCTFGNKCSVRHVEADVKPSKKSKKGGAKVPPAY